MNAADIILKVLDSDPTLRASVVSTIVTAVDAKIADLQSVRSDLSNEAGVAAATAASPAASPATPKRRGRPAGSKNKAKPAGKAKPADKKSSAGHTDKLLKALASTKGNAKGKSASELREAIPGGMEAGNFHSTVTALKKSGRVKKTGKGREAAYKLVK